VGQRGDRVENPDVATFRSSPDEQDFLARYLAVQPALRSFLATLVAGATDIDDVLQDVSLALVRSYHHYDPMRPFIAWALGIARIQAARWRRGAWSAQRCARADAAAGSAIVLPALDDERHEARRRLRACLADLDVDDRELLRLRYEQRLALADIAGLRGTTRNAINKSLGRIRRQLALRCARAGMRTP
jgi:RNA polymerase sigma-70 factor, ECF subfamily